MKHLTIFALVALVALSATAQINTNGAAQSAAQQTNAQHFTQYLSTAAFRQNVWDYTTANGQWKYKGKRPCVIDFYATWCGPCRRLTPVLEKVAEQYQGKIDIYKVDTDKEPELAQVFRITSIPTLLFVPQDSIPMLMQGAPPEETLTQIIDKALLGN